MQMKRIFTSMLIYRVFADSHLYKQPNRLLVNVGTAKPDVVQVFRQAKLQAAEPCSSQCRHSEV